MRPRRGTAEEKIGLIAARAHGVVTRAELLDAGVTIAEIRHRLRTRALVAIYRAVYRVGHQAPSVEADYVAAVRAHGEGAALCGCAAAYLYGLVKQRPAGPEVVTATKRRARGVRTRRVRRIDPRDVTTRNGIPVTTVPRTIVDLAAELPPDDLARACHEAAVRYRVTPEAIEAALARRPNAEPERSAASSAATPA